MKIIFCKMWKNQLKIILIDNIFEKNVLPTLGCRQDFRCIKGGRAENAALSCRSTRGIVLMCGFEMAVGAIRV